jgi:UDP-N-acetylglucosamine 2-epimerase (non-hydrolysing)
MKAAPLIREFKKRGKIEPLLVHTGQHYDENMSKIFFVDLELPEPDIYLGVGSGSHAQQTGKVMEAFEDVVLKERPDLIIVVGDVNSTLACSLVGSKLLVPVAHVEAGLRSFDLTMPEEINRMVTDILSRYCFTTSPEAQENLEREGVTRDRIFFVGNIMIDSLLFYLEKAGASKILRELGLEPQGYVLVTLHRPSNVDDPEIFRGIYAALGELSGIMPVVFPVHPRTRKMIDAQRKAFGEYSGLRLIDPVGYLDFVKAMEQARLVITDSGGIQEETTVLGVPCLTARENTERPITIELIPPLWDGKTAGRIADVLETDLT